jgi:hypothetical protein
MIGSNETFDFTVGDEGNDREAQLTFPWVAPFPIEALPEPIAAFSRACADSLPAPVEMIAVPALVAAAAAIGNSRAIELKRGWTEPSSLFAAVVSPSGTKKTPAMKKAVQPIQDWDSLEHRTWTADVTVEGLGRLLGTNPRGLLLVRDELSGWVKSLNQYKAGGKGADRQFYLSAWAGVPLKVDRKGGQKEGPTTISVERPCLSITGGIPPDILHSLDESSGDDDGFLPRILFSWPEASTTQWVDEVVPENVVSVYTRKIEELLHLPFEDSPVNLPLTSEAKEVWVKWHDQHCLEMETKVNAIPFMRAAYAKFIGYCARLALVHAVTNNPHTTWVGVESMASAIDLIRYFERQARKVMSALRGDHGGHIARCTEEIMRKLSVCRSAEKRQLQRNSAFPANVFKAALEVLTWPRILIDGGIITLYEPTNRQG